MKHDQNMLLGRELVVRTEPWFVRYAHQILRYGAQLLRPSQLQEADQPERRNMPDLLEIPDDEEVLAALQESADGLTPTALIRALEARDHTPENVISAIQRVLDRGKVHLSDDAKLIVATLEEPAFA